MLIMALRVLEFSNGGTKLERVLPKNKGSKGGSKYSLDLIAENQNKTNICHSVI